MLHKTANSVIHLAAYHYWKPRIVLAIATLILLVVLWRYQLCAAAVQTRPLNPRSKRRCAINNFMCQIMAPLLDICGTGTITVY